MMRDREEFVSVLNEALDEALTNTLGNSAKHVILFHLEKKYRIRREEIPRRLNEFVSGLEGILGVGARVIERNVLERLFEKCGLEFEEKADFGFSDYVEYARRHIMNTGIVR